MVSNGVTIGDRQTLAGELLGHARADEIAVGVEDEHAVVRPAFRP